MLNLLIDKLPAYAKDVKLNVSSIINNHSQLTEAQFWGSILAIAMSTKNKELIESIKNEKPEIFSDNVLYGVGAAVSIMSMTNIYYRFTHLIEDKNYSNMPAGIRMQVMRDPLVDKTDFEIWSMAVSIFTGCSSCIKAHEKQLLENNISQESIQFIAKITAIMNSFNTILVIND